MVKQKLILMNKIECLQHAHMLSWKQNNNIPRNEFKIELSIN